MLRKAKVVGKFVEFYGPGAAALPVVDRATIANMAPEYGATMGFFPIDEECVDYLRKTGRSEEHCRIYENYFRAQGLFGIPQKGRIAYSTDLELDLASGDAQRGRAETAAGQNRTGQTQGRIHQGIGKPVTENGFGKTAGRLGNSFSSVARRSNGCGRRQPGTGFARHSLRRTRTR